MPDATIEIDRSGPEALVHLKNTPGTFTVTELACTPNTWPPSPARREAAAGT